MEQAQPIHSRVLVKLSGEALAGEDKAGIDLQALKHFTNKLVELRGYGVEVALVIGGGNYMRGNAFSRHGFDRVTADQMGMLFTVANGLALRSSFVEAGLEAVLYSSFAVPGMVEAYNRHHALQQINSGKILIFSGGTGSPLFSTDSAASLRAIEIKADIILKASTVDGVYSADPKREPSATRYERLSYDTAIHNKLGVMDLSAICLCQEHDMPVRVFDMNKLDVLKNIVLGLQEEGTLISN